MSMFALEQLFEVSGVEWWVLDDPNVLWTVTDTHSITGLMEALVEMWETESMGGKFSDIPVTAGVTRRSCFSTDLS